jgi:hypothetical protein
MLMRVTVMPFVESAISLYQNVVSPSVTIVGAIPPKMTLLRDRFIARHFVSELYRMGQRTYHDVREDTTTRSNQASNTGQEHVV